MILPKLEEWIEYVDLRNGVDELQIWTHLEVISDETLYKLQTQDRGRVLLSVAVREARLTRGA